MKFKVGDKVKIKTNLVPGEYYPGNTSKVYMADQMSKYSGTEQRIERIINQGYQMAGWTWSEAMVESLSAKEVNIKNTKFGIQYVRGEDPVEFFKTKKEAQKRIEQLLDDSEVDKTSIYLFEVGKTWEVKRPVSYELLEV